MERVIFLCKGMGSKISQKSVTYYLNGLWATFLDNFYIRITAQRAKCSAQVKHNVKLTMRLYNNYKIWISLPFLLFEIMEKVTNIEYMNVDFENDIIKFLTSTPI
jgi:hypothetical protein